MTLHQLEDILDGYENTPIAETLRSIYALHARIAELETREERHRNALATIAHRGCDLVASFNERSSILPTPAYLAAGIEELTGCAASLTGVTHA